MAAAPIALFVYNRPEHTRQTLEALSKNEMIRESVLYIFSDGPKTGHNQLQLQQILEVRNLIREITWCKELRIVTREKNMGLAASIIQGVTEILDLFQKIIVLEDDLVTSPFFLQFMNQSLDFYEKDERVISVSGYIYPIKGLPSSFFIKGADCWGWATWKRGWDLLERDGQMLLDQVKERKMEAAFNYNGSYPFTGMLSDQIEGKNNSWAILWYASAFLKNKLTLYPGQSLVHNVGLDGSGTHGDGPIYETPVFQLMPPTVKAIPVQSDENSLRAISEYLKKIHTSGGQISEEFYSRLRSFFHLFKK
jgi:hypothetical protein